MTWLKDGWADDDVLSDELVQTLDFSKVPPPLKQWLINEEAVCDRLDDIYRDMLKHWPTSQRKPISKTQLAKLQHTARCCAAANVVDQICALMGIKLNELP